MYEDFNADEEMFDFSYYSVKPKYYDDLNKLFVVTINDETVGVAIEKFVELKPKMYWLLVYDMVGIKNKECK